MHLLDEPVGFRILLEGPDQGLGLFVRLRVQKGRREAKGELVLGVKSRTGKRREAITVEKMASQRMDDPTRDGVDLGPQARRDLRDELHDQVRRSVEAGARLALGGQVPERAGAWYPPGVLCGVKPGMAAFDEELFGPVAAVTRARSEEEAIEFANRSPFGLGAAVFTADLARGERIAAEQLEAGAAFVNAFVASDPRLPFGGIKESGYGRELSDLGIREFVNQKTVVVG